MLIIDAWINGIMIYVHAVSINVAAAGWENAVRTGGSQLQDGRHLETPWQVEDSREDEPVSLIRIGRAKILRRIPGIENILWLISKVRCLSVPGSGFGKSVMCVQLHLVRVTSFKRNCECVVTRATDGLRRGNPCEGIGRAKGRRQFSRMGGECRRQHARKGARRLITSRIQQWACARIDVERAELMQTQNMNIVEFQRHVLVQFLRKA